LTPDKADHRASEDMLAFLFAREAQLTAELAEVRRQQIEQRKRYADHHRLRMYPGMETLRDLYGPRREREG
jgi:hypothetical protein